MRFLILFTAAVCAAAQERVTEGDLKLVVDTPAGVAREGPSWDPAGYLYFVGNNKVSRMDSQGKVDALQRPVSWCQWIAGGPTETSGSL